MSKVTKPTLTLKQVCYNRITHRTLIDFIFSIVQFMLRQEVLKLYRELFRTIKRVPDTSSQKDLREWVRSDFQTNRNHTDELTIKMLLQHGQRSLNELKTNLELSGAADERKK